jgi:hypothetical protein
MKFFLKFILSFLAPFLVFCLALAFYFSKSYFIFPWLDIPLHFIGGASIAYSGILLLRNFPEYICIKNEIVKILILVSFVCLFAILWELWEFLLGNFLMIDLFVQGSLEDTLLDLFLGLCGGIFVAVFSKV